VRRIDHKAICLSQFWEFGVSSPKSARSAKATRRPPYLVSAAEVLWIESQLAVGKTAGCRLLVFLRPGTGPTCSAGAGS
jgi:hypothetical protein